MGTLVLNPQGLVVPIEETRPGDRADAVGPREAAPAPEEVSPLAEAAQAAVRAPDRFDLDL